MRSATRREAALLGIAEQGMRDGVLGRDRPQIESLGPDVPKSLIGRPRRSRG